MNSSKPPRENCVAPEQDAPSSKLFTLDVPSEHPLIGRLLPRAAPMLDRFFRLDALNDIYARVTREGAGQGFMGRVLDDLGVRTGIGAADFARIPKTGPVVIVANHPFGALDGIALAALLQRVRPDVKVMANFLLRRVMDCGLSS